MSTNKKPEKCQCILTGKDGTKEHSKELSKYLYRTIGGTIITRPCKNHEESYKNSVVFEECSNAS